MYLYLLYTCDINFKLVIVLCMFITLYVCIKTLDLFPRKVSIKLSEWRFELDGDKRRKNLRE